MNTSKNLILNGDFASQNLDHWEADKITAPAFTPEKIGGFSLKLEPGQYFHQNVNFVQQKDPFRLAWSFSARLYEKAHMGAWLVILAVGWKGTEMILDSSLSTTLNDQLQDFTYTGIQEFPGDLDSLAFQVINANKVTEEGLASTSINVTNFKLHQV